MSGSRLRLRPRLTSAGGSRGGFTIVELMVALVLTAILLAAVYNMFISSSTVFQTQEELGNAQYQVESAMDRLLADLRRAGFGATANSDVDPYVCAPAGRHVYGISVKDGGSRDEILHQASNAFILPDELTITGNFTTTRSYPGLGNEMMNKVSLQVVEQLPEGGTAYDPLSTLMTRTDFAAIFTVGRLVAIRNSAGYSLLTTVSSATYPDLQFASLADGVGGRCSVQGTSAIVQVNPVDIVRYRITRKYPNVNGESATMLVRDHLGLDGTPLAGTSMVVADYAVDLQLWFMFRDTNPGNNVIVDDQNPADTHSNINIPVDGTTSSRPEFIRSAVIRLAVRTEMEHPEVRHWVRQGDGDRLTTFDVDGDPETGAAPVLSITGEVDVPNFGLRDLSWLGTPVAGGGAP